MLPTHIYQKLNEKFGRKDLPALKPGETVRVHQKVKEGKKERVQIFEGIIIAAKHGTGLNGTITVRRIASNNVAVEKVLPLHLPSIVRIDRVKAAKVRRAKLYFLRGRQGKSTRFSHETSTNESWFEAVAAEPVAEEVVEEDTAIDEPVVSEAPAEEVAEAPAEEAPAEEPAKEEAKEEPAAE